MCAKLQVACSVQRHMAACSERPISWTDIRCGSGAAIRMSHSMRRSLRSLHFVAQV